MAATSPSYAEISLLTPDLNPRSGAAFELRDAAREPAVVTLDGWEAEVAEARRTIVVRGGPDTTYDDAFTGGLAIAQKALDLMSMRGGNNLMIRAFDDEHLIWWVEAGAVVIRIVSLAPVRIDVPPVTATVTDSAGIIVPPPPTPPVMWHESFRYFRLSQTSDDLFDAYRNAYLAVESVLSSIAPQHLTGAGKPAEGEGAWFRRALTGADKIVSLSAYAPPRSADPVQGLFDELYVNMRSAMSHAKGGRKILLPQDEAERADVAASLGRLVAVYLRLAEAHLGARRLGGGMFAGAFRAMVGPPLENMSVHVSDDESAFDKSDTSPNPAGGAMRALQPGGAADTSGSFVAARLWSASSADVSDLRFIRRVVGVIDDKPMMASVLEGRLVVGSAARLEVVLGARGSNSRQPRDRYSY
jgi:hypothetical protein